MTTPAGGPNGRGDNLYQLTYAVARPNKLVLELDEHVYLVITQPEITSSSTDLVSLGYGQLTLDWQEYGNMTPHVSFWTHGTLDLRSQRLP